MSALFDVSKPLEIVHNSGVNSVAFTPDGTHVVSGCNDGTIQQWRVDDGRKMGATMHADGSVLVVAISSDGKWIVSGGLDGKVTVWDAKSQKRAFESTHASEKWVSALDVSPGSTRFASASSDCMANIWSLATGQRLVGPLKHSGRVECVAFSPDGDQVATAGIYDCLRIWDSRDGELIVQVPGFFAESLVWWRDDRIFATTWSTQRWIDASSGLTLLDLPQTSDETQKMQLAVSRSRNSLAGLDKRILRLWDHTTNAWSSAAHELDYNASTISISPDSHHLVIGGEDKVSIWTLPGDTAEDADCHQNSVFMHLTCAIQKLWLHGKLDSAMQVLSRDIALNGNSYHSFANRSLVQARLQKWDNAFTDAETSVDIQPSVIGCIAKSIALCGQGKHEDSMQAFDLAFSYCTAEQINYLLLAKAVVLFLSGLHRNAIARANDLIKSHPGKSPHCYVVQAYMSVLLAKSAIESHDYNYAIRVLKSAMDPGEHTQVPELLTFSLITGWNFDLLEVEICRSKCEALFAAGHIEGAATSFLEIGFEKERNSSEQTEWIIDFRKRCVDKLEELGDEAMVSAANSTAVGHYSLALTLDPVSADGLIKRSMVYMAMGDWEAAMKDANTAIALDPSHPWGYEKKCTALHAAGRYDEAIETLNEMHSRLSKSPDSHIHELQNHYVNPSQTIAAILSFSKHVQRDFPLALIDTKNGRLCDEQERTRMFEADPRFKQLVSSMVLRIDHAAISRVVREYFRYATFSHTWEGDEPLYHDILRESIHDLAESPKMTKLLMFCKIAAEADFRWAWSDTCCINKTDGAALQESLTSMFQWYHESSLTVVHLKGVFSDSELSALEKSLWNTRAWTLQEFFASKVIRFYTEDWKPYLTLEDTFNHKESPIVMREMALATGVDAKDLLSLCPGSENVRQKLRLASTRLATKQEDIAYSLFGIFDVSIPVTYGEGQRRALGRLLQEVLTRSGDATILAWTGRASDYNSCLPAEIAVYRDALSPHLPLPIQNEEMETLLAELQASVMLHDAAVELYDRLVILPTPRLVSRRLSLSCIVFLLRTVSGPFHDASVARGGGGGGNSDDAANGDHRPHFGTRVYRATASALGEVEIRTSDDLAGLTNLVLVHPWLQCLFDPVLPHEDMIADDAASFALHGISENDHDHDHDHGHSSGYAHGHASAFGPHGAPPDGPTRTRVSVPQISVPQFVVGTQARRAGAAQHLQLPSPLDKTTRALRLFARLRRPFGALLLAPHSPREYKRVATDNPIVVRVRVGVSPHYLADKVRISDIL